MHDVVELYGLEKCSFNVHQLMHITECVRNWSPLWAWSAFTFEDSNGYFKMMNHEPNKVDMEIVNTIKMFNAHYILKDKLNISYNYEFNVELALGASKNHILNEHEIEAIQLMSYTLKIYTRQKRERIRLYLEMVVYNLALFNFV